MLKLIEKLRAKPSDKTIRLVRIGFALLLILVITFGIQKTTWNYTAIPSYLIYILYFFPLIGLVRGILDPGLFRRKVWKWTIFGLGIVMMIISLFFIETTTEKAISPVIQNVSGEISLSDFANTSSTTFVIDTDFWLGFFGFWVALFGFALTSKNITKKNERYGEKVTKIRV